MFSFKNKTVFLTGATGGIGKETALQMSSLGARKILTGTNKGKLLFRARQAPKLRKMYSLLNLGSRNHRKRT